MMKRIIFLFLLVAQTLTMGYGNNRAYYENLLELAQKEINNRNYAKTMEDLMKVKVYAKEYKLHNMQVDALNKIGFVYTNMLYYDKAMESYLEAYQIVSKQSDKTKEVSILNHIAQLYFLNNNLDKAVEYLDRAYQIAIDTEDNFIMGLLYNLAVISNKRGDLAQTEKYLNMAAAKTKQFPKDPYIAFLECVKVEYLYLKKEYDWAERLALEALEQIMRLGQEMEKDYFLLLWQEVKTDYLLLLSKIYYQKKNYPQAVSFAKEASSNNFKIPMAIEIYEHLSAIYRAKNSLSFALQYQDSVTMMKDSLLKLNAMNQILRGQIQFDLNNLEKKLIESKEKQKREQLVFVFILLFFVFLFLSFLYVRSTKNKQLKIVAELERKTYQNEIELKNRQLISKTLLQLSKNELIEEIINTLSRIPNQLENSDMQSIIQKLQSQLKDPAEANWNSFLTYFEQTNPDFLSTLKAKHPNLTANDIRLSSYIYLNLDTKEIAKLLHIAPESYKKKKRFLARKIGLSTSEIYNYLSKHV